MDRSEYKTIKYCIGYEDPETKLMVYEAYDENDRAHRISEAEFIAINEYQEENPKDEWSFKDIDEFHNDANSWCNVLSSDL